MGYSGRFLAPVALFVALAAAGTPPAPLLPDHVAGFSKATTGTSAISDQPLWDEYGLIQTEQAEYVSSTGRFELTAWRLKDATGAYGAFEWQRPPDSWQSKIAPLAAETKDSLLVAEGNYIVRFAGWTPPAAVLAALLKAVPKLDRAPLPDTIRFMPHRALLPNSTRYVIGPAGLKQFAPDIPVGVAGFELGAEAQFASYQTASGSIQLAVFSYPTPQIAIQRLAAFQKLAGVIAKRSGPLVAMAPVNQNAEAAEKLLLSVDYKATLTWDERVPGRRDNIGDLVYNACVLAGILMALFVAAGLVYGLLRQLGRRGRNNEPMILLHLKDK